MTMKTALITGTRGQDAAYLSKLLLDKGYLVISTDRRTGSPTYWRLEELGVMGRPYFKIETMDILDSHNVCQIIEKYQPDEVYNLAAQSFVAASFTQPRITSEINYIGVLNILEAIRNYSKESRYYQASTSELYGKVQEIPQKETTPFYPRSPYGVAKLAAHWLTINYRESYNLFACCGILFNHESPLRGDEFVTRKITKKVAEIDKNLKLNQKITPLSLGNMYAKRDWGFAGDYVEGMWRILQQDTPEEFVLATGKTYTIKDFVNESFKHINIDLIWSGKNEDEVAHDDKGHLLVQINKIFYRPGEVDLLLGDPTKAETKLGWVREWDFSQLVKEMVEADIKRITE